MVKMFYINKVKIIILRYIMKSVNTLMQETNNAGY